MLNCRGSGRRPQSKNMEGHYKLVGPQRPSTHGQLFASLLITRNLIFSDRRIEVSSRAAGPFILFRPGKPTKRRRSEGSPLEWPDGSAGAREQRAASQPLPTSIGMNGCAGLQPPAGSLGIRNEDQSSATIWIARAWH